VKPWTALQGFIQFKAVAAEEVESRLRRCGMSWIGAKNLPGYHFSNRSAGSPIPLVPEQRETLLLRRPHRLFEIARGGQAGAMSKLAVVGQRFRYGHKAGSTQDHPREKLSVVVHRQGFVPLAGPLEEKAGHEPLPGLDHVAVRCAPEIDQEIDRMAFRSVQAGGM
jgi:hypothetical protein